MEGSTMTQPDGWQDPYNPQHQANVPQQQGVQPQDQSGQLQPYASGPQAPYGAQQPQYVYMVAPPKNDLGVWSLVTGILSWILCPVVLGIAAIATGSASRKAVREGQANNPGMAMAGLILGWVNVGLVGGIIVVWVLFLLVAFIGAGVATSQS
jgi:hypothetical protein